MAESLAGPAPEQQPEGSDQQSGQEPAGPPKGLWDRMYADPDYAPEHLAMAAVERLGPEARRWVAQTRAERPSVTTAELTDLARRRFVKLTRASGAVAGVAGIFGAVADMGFLAWQQARMVLYIAAAHGLDPCHEDRATDLLVLQGMYSAAETARAALRVARGRAPARAVLERHGGTVPRVMLRLTMKLARMAGQRVLRRLANKVVPGAAIIFGAIGNARATDGLAGRAAHLYAHHPRDGQTG